MHKPMKRNTRYRRRSGSGGTAARGIAGLVRSRDLVSRGTSRVTIRRMVASGALHQVARGLYALPAFQPGEHHGLAVASALVPGGVVCLLSALQFHGLGTQAPFEVWLAIGGKARKPAISDPPLRIVRFSPAALNDGVDSHQLESVTVRVTSAARTVVDCFKYRNKLGIDVALEALRAYLGRRLSLDELVRSAPAVRVGNVMRPYLEAMAA
jgi:predicted transcriptional regulator of viral defense system